MTRISIRVCACTLLSIGLLGCASIVSKSSWPVILDSQPPGAKIAITDSSGQRVLEGATPTIVTLSSSRGYFRSASYTIEASRDGYSRGLTVVNARLNGWYIGNLLFGGLIGLLIVDPLTGAMWRLDERTVVALGEATSIPAAALPALPATPQAAPAVPGATPGAPAPQAPAEPTPGAPAPGDLQSGLRILGVDALADPYRSRLEPIGFVLADAGQP